MDFLNDFSLRNIINLLFKYNGPAADFEKHYVNTLASVSISSAHFLDSLVRALETPGRLMMSTSELLRLAQLLKQRAVNRAVYRRLSPRDQEQHKHLAEITLAMNAAPYAKPLGTLRRKRG